MAHGFTVECAVADDCECGILRRNADSTGGDAEAVDSSCESACDCSCCGGRERLGRVDLGGGTGFPRECSFSSSRSLSLSGDDVVR